MRILIRILGLIFVVYAALSVVKTIVGMVAPKRPVRAGPPGRLVKDPACGTYIPEDTALRAGEHFFCSEQCRQKFVKA
ncbi:MAG TPA: hypothetical protein VE422_34660 [Terriglobia bacterium]|nr:hypothetical protein [Terriglobia bacterium]